MDKLIQEIANGNENSLEELYNLTMVDVYKFALSILKSKEDAEDVMQDTYININRYAHIYDSRNKPMSWILTITKNLCLNKIKKNSRNNSADINDFENEFKVKDNNYNSVLINIIIDSLNAEERKIFILSTVHNFKFREIADLLDLKQSTVLSKYHRAIKRLKEMFKDGGIYEKVK